MKVVIGMPAYNEEKYIAKVILRAKKYGDEIIVVDDGSNDMTAEIAKALGAIVIRHEKNLGYGAALATIFKEARRRNADILIIMDADGQHDPDEIPQLLEPLLRGEADIVIGSRFRGHSEQPLWRRIGVKIITWLTKKSLKINEPITDAQSGYRAYNRKAIELINPIDNDMGASIDILAQAIKYGLRIKEVPVTIKHHEEGSTYNPILHALRVIVRIIEILSEQRPLLYIGLPGLVLGVVGLVLLLLNLHSGNKASINITELITSLILLYTSGTLITLSIILFNVKRLYRRLGHEKKNEQF